MGRGQTPAVLARGSWWLLLHRQSLGELPAPWGRGVVGTFQGRERWQKSHSSCPIYTATHLSPLPVPSVTVEETSDGGASSPRAGRAALCIT